MEKYHYTECGLDNVYLGNGFEEDESGVFIHDIHGLHRAIARTLVVKQNTLSGKEVKFIRHFLDLSQKAFGSLIGVSYQTILGWEKDKTALAEPEDRFIRTLVLLYTSQDKANEVYKCVNQIADLDAKLNDTSSHQITMEEHSDVWRAAA